MDVVAILFGVVFGGVGLAATWGGVGRLRNARSIAATDPVDVREVTVADAPIEFEGRAALPADAEPLEAPFSGEPALCDEYRIREKRRRTTRRGGRRRTKTTWTTVESGERHRPFVVDDGTGRVEVDPADATFSLEWETVTSGRGADALSRETRARLQATGGALASLADPGSSRSRRYQERRLEPGDEVHVYGAAVTEDTTGWDSDVDAKLAGCEETSLFQITRGDERDAALAQVKGGLALLLVGLAFGGFGLLTLLSGL